MTIVEINGLDNYVFTKAQIDQLRKLTDYRNARGEWDKVAELLKTKASWVPGSTIKILKDLIEDSTNSINKRILTIFLEKILISQEFRRLRAVNYTWSTPYIAVELGIPKYTHATKASSYDFTLNLDSYQALRESVRSYLQKSEKRLREVAVGEPLLMGREMLEQEIEKRWKQCDRVSVEDRLYQNGFTKVTIAHLNNGEFSSIKRNDLEIIHALI